MTSSHRRPHRRGDDIPPVSDYSHWNEDARLMWYEENKYDMAHADEIVEEPDDYLYDDEDDEPAEDEHLEAAYEDRYVEDES